MTAILQIIYFLVKNAPMIESIVAWAYKDWSDWREAYEKQKATALVKQAVALSSTDHVNNVLNGRGC